MARFDWYQGTVQQVSQVSHSAVAAGLLRCFDLADLAPSTPRNGYTKAAEVRRGDRVLARLMWEGNPGVHVIGSGENAPAVAEYLRGMGVKHRVTRADACEDWIEPGLFDSLSGALIRYAKGTRIQINQQGDWVRGQSRTLYLGARSSTSQLVLYEKGYEAGGDKNWVRLESRVYPKGEHGLRVAKWTPGECFGASAWMVEALTCIGWDHLQAQSVGTIYRPSDVERARAALLTQYGAILERWALDAGGWDSLGPVLSESLAVVRKRRVLS